MNELLLNVLGYNMATGDESRLIGYTIGRLLKNDILNPDFHLRARSRRAKKKGRASRRKKEKHYMDTRSSPAASVDQFHD